MVQRTEIRSSREYGRYRGRHTSGGGFTPQRSVFALLLLILASLSGQLCAGGGPETTLLVVNAQSPLSLRIANEYARLRDIPRTHLLHLDDVPSGERITIGRFREKIWRPIEAFIREQGLTDQIDTITYSADFPYSVDFRADLKKAGKKGNKLLGKLASLTSLTYFARRVAVEEIGYLGRNHYFRSFPGPKIKPLRVRATSPKLDEKQIKSLRKASRKALRRKEYAKAIESARELLASHPQSPENWIDLARAQAASGETAAAMTALSNAVDLGWTNSLSIRHDPLFDAVKDRTDFIALLERMEKSFQPLLEPHGFSSRYVWSDADLAFWENKHFMDQYYLSTLLAYTGVRGNSYPEIMRYLRAAEASDGSQPDGSVYLMENGNVRSTTRQHLFPVTLEELAKRGRRGEILSRRVPGQNGVLPVGKTDVIGVMAGAAVFDWRKSGSRLLPGAIAESLTSYGGDFNRSAQTKLTEFLRYGAAGSSGTVTEPFALQQKFPVALLHATYADGCSLAEAFYQSIEFPFQLIIVGDPLARPFARFAPPRLAVYDQTTPWSGTVILWPTAASVAETAPKGFELWLDGRRLATAVPGGFFKLDTRELADGIHRVRLVAIENSRIETRSYTGFPVRVANHRAVVEVDQSQPRVVYGEETELGGRAPDGADIRLFDGHRELARTTAEHGRWYLEAATGKMGPGPVRLLLKARLADGTNYQTDLDIEVTEPQREPAQPLQRQPGAGLQALLSDAQGETHGVVLEQLDGDIRIPDGAKGKLKRVRLEGYLRVPTSGFYQLTVRARGGIRLALNERVRLDAVIGKNADAQHLPLSLEAGWHKLQVDMEVSGRAYLRAVLSGDQVPALLGGEQLGHL